VVVVLLVFGFEEEEEVVVLAVAVNVEVGAADVGAVIMACRGESDMDSGFTALKADAIVCVRGCVGAWVRVCACVRTVQYCTYVRGCVRL
jgi:hypothetical protein